jgi:hypothetical protein
VFDRFTRQLGASIAQSLGAQVLSRTPTLK